MSDPERLRRDIRRNDPRPPAQVPPTPTRTTKPSYKSDAVVCERCGVEMFRMHAVWRCPGCGFKTDCCGW